MPPERLETALAAAPSTAQELLDELVVRGILDEEDLEILKGLARQGHSEAPPGGSDPTRDEGPPVASGNGLSSGSIGGAGRKVLRQQSEPSWGPYRNLRFIGEGGMGRIFKAYDPMLKRTVALKLLRHQDPALVERFTLEAQHQARVEHPNIAKVFAVGEWEGQPYLAMQFIRGETLEGLEAKLSLEAKVRVMEQVAEAVHAAHRQGLIHRDLKPANIMVEREGDGLIPFVLDFGLARGVDPTGRTLQGAVMGTMHYMAPEQAKGAQDQIGRQTDVYGLGATLHRLLTGRPPFFDGQGLDVARLTLETDLPSLRKLKPELPEDLDLLVCKCMEKDPVNRYRNAHEVAEELRRWLAGEPLQVRRPTLSYRAGKWARRHRIVVAVSGVALLSLMVLGGYSARVAWTAKERVRWAQHFSQEAERIESLLRYAHLLPRHDISNELAQVRGRLEGLEAQALNAGRTAEAPAHYALGRAWLALGDPEKAKHHLDRARAEGLVGPDLSLALGRVLGSLYQLQVEQARRIAAPDLREERLRNLDTTLRQPALNHLRQGSSASLLSPWYLEALLAFHAERWEEALRLAREASKAQPWLHEARLLEGDVLLAQALACERSDPARSRRLVEEAAGPFQGVMDRAPSDPSGYRREVARCIESMILDRNAGQEPEGHLKQALKVLSQGQQVAAEDPLLLELQGQALMTWIQHLRDRGRPFEDLAREVVVLMGRRLTQGPSLSALRTLASAWQLLALAESRRGVDPDPALERARSALEQALALDSADPALAFRLGGLEARQMALNSQRGIPPWPAFERALRGLSVARDLAPQSTIIRGSLAQLWTERADYERQHGLDPRPSCAEARREVGLVLGREPGYHRWWQTLANAWLIEGQYLCAWGSEGGAALGQALEAYGRFLEIKPDVPSPWVERAECQLIWAEGLLEAGREAWTLLKGARRDLDQAAQLGWAGESYYASVRGRLGILEAEAGDAEGLLRARDLLRTRRADPSADATPQLVLAEVACRGVLKGRKELLSEGLRACDLALGKNPRSGEALMWRGALRGLQAQGFQGSARANAQAQALADLTRAFEQNANLRRRIESLRRTLGVATSRS